MGDEPSSTGQFSGRKSGLGRRGFLAGILAMAGAALAHLTARAGVTPGSSGPTADLTQLQPSPHPMILEAINTTSSPTFLVGQSPDQGIPVLGVGLQGSPIMVSFGAGNMALFAGAGAPGTVTQTALVAAQTSIPAPSAALYGQSLSGPAVVQVAGPPLATNLVPSPSGPFKALAWGSIDVDNILNDGNDFLGQVGRAAPLTVLQNGHGGSLSVSSTGTAVAGVSRTTAVAGVIVGGGPDSIAVDCDAGASGGFALAADGRVRISVVGDSFVPAGSTSDAVFNPSIKAKSLVTVMITGPNPTRSLVDRIDVNDGSVTVEVDHPPASNLLYTYWAFERR